MKNLHLLILAYVFHSDAQGSPFPGIFGFDPPRNSVGKADCLNPSELAIRCHSHNWESIECNVTKLHDIDCSTQCQLVFANRILEYSGDWGNELGFRSSGRNFNYPKCTEKLQVELQRTLGRICLKSMEFHNFEQVSILAPILEEVEASESSIRVSLMRHEELFCFSRHSALPIVTEIRYISSWEQNQGGNEVHVIEEEGFEIEATVELKDLIPNSKYTLWIRQRPLKTQEWTQPLLYTIRTPPGVPAPPITSNFTHEILPHTENRYRILLYWTAVAEEFHFGTNFSFELHGVCSRHSVTSSPIETGLASPPPTAPLISDSPNESSPRHFPRQASIIPEAVYTNPEGLGPRFVAPMLKGAHSWHQDTRDAFHEFIIDRAQVETCRISIQARNVAGLSGPGDPIVINMPGAIPPRVLHRSAVIKWSNGTRRVLWEMSNSWPSGSTHLVPSTVEMIWCHHKSVLCQKGITFNGSKVEQWTRGSGNRVVVPSGDMSSIRFREPAVFASVFHSSEETLSQVALAFPNLSPVMTRLPCSEIEEGQLLRPQLSWASGPRARNSLSLRFEITFQSCPTCPTHLGLLVKEWRIWICPQSIDLPSFPLNNPCLSSDHSEPPYRNGPPPETFHILTGIVPGREYEVILETHSHFDRLEQSRLQERILLAPPHPPRIVSAVILTESDHILIRLEDLYDHHTCEFALDDPSHRLDLGPIECQSLLELQLDPLTLAALALPSDSRPQQPTHRSACPSLRVRACNPAACSTWSERVNNIEKGPDPAYYFQLQEFPPQEVSISWTWDSRVISDGVYVEISNSIDGDERIDHFTHEFSDGLKLNSNSCSQSRKQSRSLSISLSREFCFGEEEVKFQLRVRGFRHIHEDTIAPWRMRPQPQQVSGPWSEVITTKFPCQAIEESLVHLWLPIGLGVFLGSALVTGVLFYTIARFFRLRREFLQMIHHVPPEDTLADYRESLFRPPIIRPNKVLDT